MRAQQFFPVTKCILSFQFENILWWLSTCLFQLIHTRAFAWRTRPRRATRHVIRSVLHYSNQDPNTAALLLLFARGQCGSFVPVMSAIRRAYGSPWFVSTGGYVLSFYSSKILLPSWYFSTVILQEMLGKRIWFILRTFGK